MKALIRKFSRISQNSVLLSSSSRTLVHPGYPPCGDRMRCAAHHIIYPLAAG
jgi:hypothetical protein